MICMRVEYDRHACSGWFQCVQKWDAFKMNMSEEKADLENAVETEDQIFVREIDPNIENEVKEAAESCPVDAIIVYDNKGNQIVP